MREDLVVIITLLLTKSHRKKYNNNRKSLATPRLYLKMGTGKSGLHRPTLSPPPFLRFCLKGLPMGFFFFWVGWW